MRSACCSNFGAEWRCLWPLKADSTRVYTSNGASRQSKIAETGARLHYGHVAEMDVASHNSHGRTSQLRCLQQPRRSQWQWQPPTAGTWPCEGNQTPIAPLVLAISKNPQNHNNAIEPAHREATRPLQTGFKARACVVLCGLGQMSPPGMWALEGPKTQHDATFVVHGPLCLVLLLHLSSNVSLTQRNK